jgi:DNA polymerase III subunit chi
MTNVKVIYFTIKDANTKVKTLLQTVTSHFLKKEKIQILVPDNAALEFVDRLLWSQPKESFLPHSCEAILPHQDLIHLSLPIPSYDSYPIVFNLCQTPHPSSSTLKILYELEDLSHPKKAASFQSKFKEYQKLGHTLCVGD